MEVESAWSCWLSWGVCWLFLGAESLQEGNKISESGVCHIVSCILHNEKSQVAVYCDFSPLVCARHEAWRSEGLPSLKADVVRDDWGAVLSYLRQV